MAAATVACPQKGTSARGLKYRTVKARPCSPPSPAAWRGQEGGLAVSELRRDRELRRVVETGRVQHDPGGVASGGVGRERGVAEYLGAVLGA